jgi:hypothetical protein
MIAFGVRRTTRGVPFQNKIPARGARSHPQHGAIRNRFA